jgi:hypothetical protein
MSVKLEKYFVRQRKNLDVESPDDKKIWDSVRSKIQHDDAGIKQLNNKIRILRIRNIAATAIILFSLGYIANDIVNRKMAGSKITLSSIDSQLGKREMDYKTLVNYKTGEVKTFTGSNDKVIVQLFSEIKELDLIYDQAMKDLRELGPDDKVINTIFSTYEQKIRLLELIILETNKKDSHENNKKIIF